MSEHSVIEAESRLLDLIQRSLAGESVVITVDGRPAVALKPVQPPRRPVTAEDLDRMMANLVPSSSSIDAAELVRRMRDGEPN